MTERSNSLMLLKLLGCKLYYLVWVVQEENDGSM